MFASVLAAARAGSPWAFERLYADLAGQVTGYLRMQGAVEPDDLASEVFIGVFSGLPRFEGDEAGFRSWVFTIAHRRLLDERRRLAKTPHLTSDDVLESMPGDDVESDVLAGLEEGWVRQVCAELPSDQRAVVLLRVLGDLSTEQVAEIMGKSTGAVKQLQRRAITSLRVRLTSQSVPPASGSEITGAR
ncbi:sigma-70 family RNA polymerase sigma factor [Planosporangium flavigriseum]|uniref:RNA polymerase sigma factor n=1 Tax=Planosporangium flavigriseum TaxID=373681 RepID=UPI00143971BF|nr:sigma-70 family RNA polymerase sigma factor [Planosporangium flavigriseum]NJC66730.1 sigma-70 family RNA polymerase sigma factor [Planosporangium flavigriseum]